MPYYSCRFWRCAVWTLICFVSLTPAGWAATDLGYVWKPNDVLRFEFIKTISIEEDTEAVEVFNDRPAVLNENVALLEFKRADGEVSSGRRIQGAPFEVASCRKGSKLTITGVIKEDSHFDKWVEVRTEQGLAGYIPGKTKVHDTRWFSFNAILIVEIKNRTETGTFAVFHFDSAQITFPEMYGFLATSDDPAVIKDRAKAVQHALEGAIKLARWNVTLTPSGITNIETRVPKGLDDWMKETEHAAFWRARFRKLWVELVEKNLNLAASGADHDLLIALSGEAAAPKGELQKIRPYRSSPEVAGDKFGKVELRFQRLPPPFAGKPFSVPFIGPPEDLKSPGITMTFKLPIKGPRNESDPAGPAPQIGSAIFDSKLNMLDTLNEAYSFNTSYACSPDVKTTYNLEQTVSVTYSLKRLAPPILVRVEQAIEAPINGR
ncbi:MAG: hypothetical protein WCT04_05370 [Planctomycetota bacterium]